MDIYQSTKPAPYVYICVHKHTKYFYIGYREKNVSLNRTSDIDLPLYKTSSKFVKPIFEEFEWQIIAEFVDTDSAYDFEQSLIQENWNNPLLINKQYYKGKNARFKNYKHSEKTKQKIKNSLKNRIITDNHRFAISESKKGSITWNKGIPRTVEDRKLISEKRKETAKRVGAWNFGKLHSKETLDKISNKARNRMKYTCLHCGKEIAGDNYFRWHGENCKLKML
jgi:rubrerythrin